MQSLVATHGLYTAVFYIALIVWGINQLYANRYYYAAPGLEGRNRRSYWFSAVMITAGIIGAILCMRYVPATTFPSVQPVIFWIGIALMAMGLLLRWYVIRVLARYFAPDKSVRPDREVIENGPFRQIRHPGYTGVLITVLGFGLATTNWLGLLVVLVFSLVGYAYRVRVEEQVLCEALGDTYREYMRRTRRFIPYLW
ncbi:MAG: isoprenylcysteine carboxylmethyltransferase family protein [Gammaproteobacteria bacterium]|nr:isoprenylcysteine carboxylmethyltransferase family protein [Gammaproteobacteria bacterium]